MRRRWFILLTLATTLLAAGIGASLWHWAQVSSLTTIQDRIAAAQPWLTAFRCASIGLVTLLWPITLNGLQRGKLVNQARAAQLHLYRWRLLAWLIILELILGQNLLGRFLVTLQGGNP